MRKQSSLCLLAAFLFCISPSAYADFEKQVLEPSVHVEAPCGLFTAVGSGTVLKIDGDYYVLTASHVVEGCYVPRLRNYDFFSDGATFLDKTPQEVKITLRDGRVLKATPCFRTKDYTKQPDLALCKFKTNPKHLLAASYCPRVKPRIGETTWYCGSGGGVAFGLEKSIVSRLCDETLTTNGSIAWYGHSGSAVYIKRGKKYFVVAVVSRFMQNPGENPRSPIECERRLEQFFRDYSALRKASKNP